MPEIKLSRKQILELIDIFDRFFKDRKPSIKVFGSRVTHDSRPASDLDLLVRDKEPIAFSRMAYLREAFEESDLPFKVDVVDAHRADSDFVARVEGGAVDFPW